VPRETAGWAFGDDPPYSVEPDLLARDTHLEAWAAFDFTVKHLKKHRRDDLTFKEVERLYWESRYHLRAAEEVTK